MSKRSHLRPAPGILAWLSGFFTVLTLAIVVTVRAAEAAETSPRNIMLDAYQAIAYLLPLSVRSYTEDTTYDGELVDAAIARLASAGDQLTSHAKGEDTEFMLLARSFDRTVEDAALAFRGGLPAYAYFLMMDITQYCTACHSKTPGDTGPMFSQKLLARMDTRVLERDEMARLYVALRQFDRAQTTFEELLLNPETHPIDADLDGLLIEYLTLSLTSEPDVRRADAFLRRYADRRDMPFYLERRIAAWRQAMADLGDALGRPATLAEARALFDSAADMKRVPYDRAGAVHDVIAARMLRQLINTDAFERPAERQEAYFMLGLIHLRTLEPRPAVPEMELLLEAAIRAKPDGYYAPEAYALLEEYGYVEDDLLAYAARNTGMSERPPVIDMAELRELVLPDAPPE